MSKKRKPRSATQRAVLTQRRLADLMPPASGRRYVFDAKTPSLAIMITEKGSKSWYLVKRVKGRPVRTRLGGWPDVNVEDARRLAADALGEIANGRDPHAERKGVRREATLSDLWEQWLEIHAKPHKRSWKEDERMYAVYLAPLHRGRLGEITQAAVADLHVKIGRDRGHVQANRVLDLLGVLYRFAEARGWQGKNPRTGVKKFRERPRERFLDGDEIRRFVEAVAAEPDRTLRDYWLALLLTGARSGNVRRMRWDDLNFQRGLWRVGGEASKTGEPMVLVLSPPVVRLLESRHGLIDSPWVFPRSDDPERHLARSYDQWYRLRKRAGVADLTPHDLRRTLGSWMAAGGMGLPVIGKALGHQHHGSTQIYARLDTDPIKAAVNATTEAMLTVAGIDPTLPAPTEDTDDGKAQSDTAE